MKITSEQLGLLVAMARKRLSGETFIDALAANINGWFGQSDEIITISLSADPRVEQFFASLDDRLGVVESQIATLSAE